VAAQIADGGHLHCIVFLFVFAQSEKLKRAMIDEVIELIDKECRQLSSRSKYVGGSACLAICVMLVQYSGCLSPRRQTPGYTPTCLRMSTLIEEREKARLEKDGTGAVEGTATMTEVGNDRRHEGRASCFVFVFPTRATYDFFHGEFILCEMSLMACVWSLQAGDDKDDEPIDPNDPNAKLKEEIKAAKAKKCVVIQLVLRHFASPHTYYI
jgi:hypothetical protein